MDLLDGQHGAYYLDFTISELDFYKTLANIQKGIQKDKVMFHSEVSGKDIYQSWIVPAKGDNGGSPFDCIIEFHNKGKEFLGICYFRLADAPCPASDYETACSMAKTFGR